MRVGILGSGTVAQTLAKGFVHHGHQVTMGTRTVSKLADFAAQNPGIAVASFAQAAEAGEIVVLAVKGTVASECLRALPASSLTGKVVMDTTNPIADAPPVNGVLKFFTTLDDSLMEQLQRQSPQARFVKAFSCVGNALMVNPQLAGGPPTMFICGNDPAAKQTVTDILGLFGWDVADMGQAESARAIEPLCILWCARGFTGGGWTHAFKLLR